MPSYRWRVHLVTDEDSSPGNGNVITTFASTVCTAEKSSGSHLDLPLLPLVSNFGKTARHSVSKLVILEWKTYAKT
ncbi:hypothetical protein JEQ12_003984 [Ovis aries]|uniref:Uncharacterized protein n=1 Tax=Ovis aries TaxID=9940 RepID=A0A835ZXY1_SHEEP|nr:hypothetical protein JEQ12_003984 [Ovis aries]